MTNYCLGVHGKKEDRSGQSQQQRVGFCVLQILFDFGNCYFYGWDGIDDGVNGGDKNNGDDWDNSVGNSIIGDNMDDGGGGIGDGVGNVIDGDDSIVDGDNGGNGDDIIVCDGIDGIIVGIYRTTSVSGSC